MRPRLISPKARWPRSALRCRHDSLAIPRALSTSTSQARQVSAIPSGSTVFSGIQPTGVPHLGNWLGALQQWVEFQRSDSRLLFSIVDLHAITVPQPAEQLRQWRQESLATLLAIGLDPKRCSIFFQSQVSAHAELMWTLTCTSSLGHLSRMTTWKACFW